MLQPIIKNTFEKIKHTTEISKHVHISEDNYHKTTNSRVMYMTERNAISETEHIFQQLQWLLTYNTTTGTRTSLHIDFGTYLCVRYNGLLTKILGGGGLRGWTTGGT